MSKIGFLPLPIPSSLSATLANRTLTIKGEAGEFVHQLDPRLTATLVNNELRLTRQSEAKPVRALHGLTRALIANSVAGLTHGFTKILELVGTGYRVRQDASKLILSLGFSHEVNFVPPSGITLAVEGTNLIRIQGIDKQLVGQVAATIRALRPPEPYKGKGIRYQNEVVRRKAGKTAKTTGGAA